MKKNNIFWTSANIVTVIRICLVPIFVIGLLIPWNSFWINDSINFIKSLFCLVIFCLLSLTDSLDGYLARSKNQVTNFGKFMDPLADKILVFSALVSFVQLSIIPAWIVLVILFREFIISGIRMLAASNGQVIAASWYGKAKTITQLLAIILFLLKDVFMSLNNSSINDILFYLAWSIMAISLILTIVSMIDYIIKAKDVILNNNNNKEQLSATSKKVIDLSKKKKVKISCAESITGGLISSSLTDISGSSYCFKGGISSYSYDAKNNILDINLDYLINHGAVNEEVAKKMAKSSRSILHSDVSVSTTGIAGPNSDEFNTTVGTVYIGISTKHKTYAKKYKFEGNREHIKYITTLNSLKLLYNEITKFN